MERGLFLQLHGIGAHSLELFDDFPASREFLLQSSNFVLGLIAFLFHDNNILGDNMLLGCQTQLHGHLECLDHVVLKCS